MSEYTSDKMWEDVSVGGNHSKKLSHAYRLQITPEGGERAGANSSYKTKTGVSFCMWYFTTNKGIK